jgi:hypothetical protein
VERKAKIAADIAYKKTWGWKDEGKQTYSNLKDAFRGVETVLVPHQLKRRAMEELLKHVEKFQENHHSIFKRISRLILNEIYPFSLRGRKKSSVIARKQM